jgi:hypothetical protein
MNAVREALNATKRSMTNSAQVGEKEELSQEQAKQESTRQSRRTLVGKGHFSREKAYHRQKNRNGVASCRCCGLGCCTGWRKKREMNRMVDRGRSFNNRGSESLQSGM